MPGFLSLWRMLDFLAMCLRNDAWNPAANGHCRPLILDPQWCALSQQTWLLVAGTFSPVIFPLCALRAACLAHWHAFYSLYLHHWLVVIYSAPRLCTLSKQQRDEKFVSVETWPVMYISCFSLQITDTALWVCHGADVCVKAHDPVFRL